VRKRLVEGLLRLYERAVEAGLLDRPWARRGFESLYIVYKRLLEAGPTSKLRELVEPGSAVIDVGANIGFFSLSFGRWVGPRGRVIAIEPERHNFESLRRRIDRAHLSAIVEPIQAVAADQPGERRLAVNPTHPGDHRIADTGEPVRAVTLDQLTEGSSRRVSLVKVDVQGAEQIVLGGASRVLAKDRPALFVEVDDEALRNFGSSARELIETVVARGYVPHDLSRQGLRPIADTEALLASAAAGSYTDVVFVIAAGRQGGR
jgi:FkbM family methyltransferase